MHLSDLVEEGHVLQNVRQKLIDRGVSVRYAGVQVPERLEGSFRLMDLRKLSDASACVHGDPRKVRSGVLALSLGLQNDADST